MHVSGQLQALAALLRGISPRYPLDRRLDEPQNWYGLYKLAKLTN
jgi:hypothetical protein